jgi:hypothetical protein
MREPPEYGAKGVAEQSPCSSAAVAALEAPEAEGRDPFKAIGGAVADIPADAGKTDGGGVENVAAKGELSTPGPDSSEPLANIIVWADAAGAAERVAASVTAKRAARLLFFRNCPELPMVPAFRIGLFWRSCCFRG